MAVVKIYKYPHIHLRTECQPVSEITGEVLKVCEDLVDTMYAQSGAVGLSAPQIGQSLRIIVLDVSANTTKDQLRVMINPEIKAQSRNKLVREGCLSFPDYLVNSKRATKLTVRYQTPTGAFEELETKHLEAIAIQHEIDHLDGVLMIDRVQSLKTDLIRRYTQASSAQTSSSAQSEEPSEPSFS